MKKPLLINDLIQNYTRIGAQHQKGAMGFLGDKVTPQEFARFFDEFTKGINYVYKRFHTTFDFIDFTDEGLTHYKRLHNKNGTFSHGLIISRSEILELIEASRNHSARLSTPKIKPHTVTPMQMATLSGVEEAYHQHQFRTDGEKWSEFLQPLQQGKVIVSEDEIDESYGLNPIEVDAGIIVREAAKDFGFIPNHISKT